MSGVLKPRQSADDAQTMAFTYLNTDTGVLIYILALLFFLCAKMLPFMLKYHVLL